MSPPLFFAALADGHTITPAIAVYENLSQGRVPTGPPWDAFNLLTNQIGELTYIVVAPPRTPAAQVAALHQGFEGVARDPAFERELMARQGVPYSHIGTAQGQAIFRALAEASPDVIRTLHDATKAPN